MSDMKRQRDYVDTLQELIDEFRRYDELYEVFANHKYSLSMKNDVMRIEYTLHHDMDVIGFQLFDAISQDLSHKCMDVVRLVVENGQCKAAHIKIVDPYGKTTEMFYPEELVVYS